MLKMNKPQVTKRTLQPENWAKPRGYANGVSATGEVISVAGQIGWNAQCQFESDDFADQTRLALENVMAVLACANAGPEHIVRMTWYVTSKTEYLAAAKAIGGHYKSLMQDAQGTVHYPAMTAVQVVALIEDRAKVEIEVTAVK
jgi:enamine deaminase RidA (YjgF/YER057c/UK114 family)